MIYWYDHIALQRSSLLELPGVASWCAIYSVFREVLVDRTRAVRTPLRVAQDPQLQIPELGAKVVMFDDACQAKVAAIIAQAEAKDVPIYVLFSGGIDSTTIAAAFMLYAPQDVLARRLKVVTSTEAWVENERFMRDYIVPSYEVISSRRLPYLAEEVGIFVDGEMNDYYVPNSQKKNLRTFGFDERTPYETAVVEAYLVAAGMQKKDAALWAGQFHKTVLQAPMPVATLEDFLWWVRFTWTRQSYAFLPYFGMGSPQSITSLASYHEKVVHFFDSTEFQQWAMQNDDRSPKKRHCRALIRRVFDDPWVDEKRKYNSMRELFAIRPIPVALDETFQAVSAVEELRRYYDPENEFRN